MPTTEPYFTAFRNLFEELQYILMNESHFREGITKAIGLAEEKGLQLECVVQTGAKILARYGHIGGAASATEPFDIGSVRCNVSWRSSKGDLPRDLVRAREIWDLISPLLQKLLEEHWGAREPTTEVWTGQDVSHQTKRLATVTQAAREGKCIAYVRLDCDGFGDAKKRLGGEELANEVIQHVAEFFRTSLADQCLVFHPHGDEFELIFIGTESCDVFKQLHHFQCLFRAQDFRPTDHTDSVTLGIRMAVSLWPFSEGPLNPDGVLPTLIRLAGSVEFKQRPDRGFIELAQDDTVQSDGVLTIHAIQEAVLRSHRGLLDHQTAVFPNDLLNYIARCLLEDQDQEASLSERLLSLAKVFVLKVFSDTHSAAFGLPVNIPASRIIHSAQLAALMLHVLLKRRFLGKGPLDPHDFVRISLNRSTETNADGRLKIERKEGDSWQEVLGFDGVPFQDEIQQSAGYVWVLRDTLDAQCVGRWVSSENGYEDLSPCLVALVGSVAGSLADQLRPWCAGVIKIDDRPVTSGHLPDFWQSNTGRIIGSCLENPNIRALVLVRENPDTVRRTHEVLLGACRICGQDVEDERLWTDDRISEIAAATTVKEPRLRHFLQRKVCLLEINADINVIRQALVERYSETPEHLTAVGEQDQFEPLSEQPHLSEETVKHEFKAASLGDAFPNIIRALRHPDTPRYSELDGRQLAELTGVRVELTAPLQVQIPTYWRSDRGAFEQYYTRAFSGADSLFGSRLYHWGVQAGCSGGTDQVGRAVEETVKVITMGRVDRRIVLTTSQPPGKSGSDPLGLSTIHLLPRLRIQSGTKIVYLDFLWVWRSVEAIVGFPFSMYGSVRFSNDLAEKVRGAMPQASSHSLALGSVTYLAISLHLYRDTPDLAIARHIDLEARP